MDIIRDEDDDPGDDEEGRPGDAADDDMFLFFLTTPPGRGATESSVETTEIARGAERGRDGGALCRA